MSQAVYIKITNGDDLDEIIGNIYKAEVDSDGDYVVEELVEEYDIIFSDEVVVVTEAEYLAQQAEKE